MLFQHVYFTKLVICKNRLIIAEDTSYIVVVHTCTLIVHLFTIHRARHPFEHEKSNILPWSDAGRFATRRCKADGGPKRAWSKSCISFVWGGRAWSKLRASGSIASRKHDHPLHAIHHPLLLWFSDLDNENDVRSCLREN